MVNITVQELSETKVQELPNPQGDTSVLWNMRADACSAESSVFKLQPQQRFLRRVLSPDAPTQSLLMVHGTGTGKTCTGIQIAEEFIVRPEYQDKRVFVLASQSVQENFRTQIFDVSRVETDASGDLLSRQCTGRRYLDILQRMKSQPLKWSDQAGRESITKSASKIIDEFYEFWGYVEFGNELGRQQLGNTKDVEAWIHKTFDNRLVIIDEAHNLRDTTESSSSEKIVSAALTKIVQVAHGMTLVLLTATPMYDSYEEILFYFNLFLWNEKIHKKSSDVLKASEFFTKQGDVVDAKKVEFKKLCNRYVSYIKGENPFTFPFRLDPPDDLKAKLDRSHDPDGNKIISPIQYLTLTQNLMSPYQSEIVRGLNRASSLQEYRTICVLPGNGDLGDVMTLQGDKYRYTGIPFLSKSNIPTYSAKFATVLKCIEESKGIVFVYSNRLKMGAKLFAMCLEEHGFTPAIGEPIMAETSGEIQRGSGGSYALFTSEMSDTDIKNTLLRLKRKDNMDGSKIRVVIASPKVSEGVDFRFIRQVHVLDPWYNMSRIEQVIGRGMRTCSHALLPQKEQNSTVYLHVNRHPNDRQETHDEYIYREFVEKKAIGMAKVKQIMMGSAMDCTLESSVNTLPMEWQSLKVQQQRAQRAELVERKLSELVAPVFLENASFQCDPVVDDGEYHERPLSAMLDVKDEILDKLRKMLRDKPVWTQTDLYASLAPYDQKLIQYILQNAVSQGATFKGANGRPGRLEIKDGLVAFASGENDTLVDRLIPLNTDSQTVEIPEVQMRTAQAPVAEIPVGVAYEGVRAKLAEYRWGAPVATNKKSWIKFWEQFSYEIQEWFFVDHELKGEERTQHILNTLNSGVVPPYLARLIVNGPRKFYVLGPDEFYTPDKQKFVPIGADLDAYKSWLNGLKQRFVDGKNEYFAAMKGDAFVFNVDETKVPAERAARTKNIGGRTCSFFDEKIIRSFARWVGNIEFPPENSPEEPNKKGKCAWLDLLARKAVVDKKPGISWYTPEEFAILSEEANRKDVLARMKN
jgi:Type III restriction enzyme, res subunit/Helicase conserved C-terminal domain